MKYQTMKLDNYDLTYWDSKSSKPTLILIHGFGTSGKFQWFKEARLLSGHYRLIIVNMLYFGSKPATPVYSVEGQADAVYALTNKLSIDSFYLCGASYGGLVAASFALMHPDKIRKLVLVDAPLKFHLEKDIISVCKKYNITSQEELHIPSNAVMFKKLMDITYYKSPKVPMYMIRSFYRNTFGKDRDDLQKIYHCYMNDRTILAAQDYHYKVPVLLIWGKEDRLVPLRVGQELKDHIGDNARLEIVPDAAHLPNIENKKVVNRLILDFLKG